MSKADSSEPTHARAFARTYTWLAGWSPTRTVARPGAVLAADSTRDELGDDAGFSWSFAGARHLKGIKGEARLFRARRGDAETT